jgi:hypothetical protein
MFMLTSSFLLLSLRIHSRSLQVVPRVRTYALVVDNLCYYTQTTLERAADKEDHTAYFDIAPS